MSKVLIIATGGTIESVSKNDDKVGGAYLTQANNQTNNLASSSSEPVSDALIEAINELGLNENDFDLLRPFRLDSANVMALHWLEVAKLIVDSFKKNEDYKGVLVLHGTDTLTYTTSALWYVLNDFFVKRNKRLLVTGSQLPLSHESTDAYQNLGFSLDVLRGKFDETENMHPIPYNGVFVSFSSQLMHPLRTIKIDANSFEAFRDKCYEEYIEIYSNNPLNQYHDYFYNLVNGCYIKNEQVTEQLLLKVNGSLYLDNGKIIGVHKIFPHMRMDIFVVYKDYRFLILELLGVGGTPINDNFYRNVELLARSGVKIYGVSTLPFGWTNMSVYETGVKLKSLGVEQVVNISMDALITQLVLRHYSVL